jgi:hypothetical protein
VCFLNYAVFSFNQSLTYWNNGDDEYVLHKLWVAEVAEVAIPERNEITLSGIVLMCSQKYGEIRTRLQTFSSTMSFAREHALVRLAADEITETHISFSPFA